MFVITDASDSTLPEVISLDDDSDVSSQVSSSQFQMLKRPMENPSTPSAKRQGLDPRSGNYNSAATTPSFVRTKHEDGSPGQPRRPSNGAKSNLFDKYKSAGKRFMTISEVKTIINQHRRPGHPGIVTPAAREEICMTSLWAWNGPLKALSDATYSMLRTAVLRILERTLGRYKQTDLFRQSKRKVLDFLAQHHAEQRRSLDAFYELETYKLFTLNESAFLKYQEEELRILQAKRRVARVRCFIQRHAYLTKKTLSDAAKQQMEKSITDDELGPDPFKLEIETAAYVRGYYRTAGYRFSDNLCQNIQGNLLKTVHKDIAFLLENHFGLNTGDGRCPSNIT
jgi:hypothetical protein